MIHRRGAKAAYESKSEDPRLRCVFEDDSSTGYLYVIDYTDGSAQPIKDAVSIYNVDAVNDVDHSIEFRWSQDGRRCALYIDELMEGFVDFDRKMALARSNFPVVSPWTRESRSPWSESLKKLLDEGA